MVVEIYTDGASRGNPGPGGYGVVMESGPFKKEFAEGFRKTTNNRMELLAVIVGLEKIKKEGLRIKIYSDSKYVVDAVNEGWVFGWHKKGLSKDQSYGYCLMVASTVGLRRQFQLTTPFACGFVSMVIMS